MHSIYIYKKENNDESWKEEIYSVMCEPEQSPQICISDDDVDEYDDSC